MVGDEGMTAKEVAHVTGIKVTSIGARLFQLRQKGRVRHDRAAKKYRWVAPDIEDEASELSPAELAAAIDAEFGHG